MTHRVAVIGGGISGLAAARDLARSGAAAVTVFEADDRLGGRVGTVELAGMAVETGPDVFLARVPDATKLVRDVGLGDDLISPDTGDAFIWSRRRLRPLPRRHLLGVPTDLADLARSRVVSMAGVARAAMDLTGSDPIDLSDDPTVGDVLRPRLGDEVVERLVGPLIGGINAGDVDALSMKAAVPQVAAALDGATSVIRAARDARNRAPATGPDNPVFHSVAGGLGRVIERLAGQLTADGADVRTGTKIESLTLDDDGRPVLHERSGPATFDAVVIATPAPVTGRLLFDVAPMASQPHYDLPMASVLLATFVYDRADVAHPLRGSGALVPRVEGRLITACTWYSSKWASTATRPDRVVVRVSAGRADDTRAFDMATDAAVEEMVSETAEMIGARRPPLDTAVFSHRDGFPQYGRYHQARIDGAEEALRRVTPRIALAGSAYRGVGLPACIRSGQGAAQTVLEALR